MNRSKWEPSNNIKKTQTKPMVLPRRKELELDRWVREDTGRKMKVGSYKVR